MEIIREIETVDKVNEKCKHCGDELFSIERLLPINIEENSKELFLKTRVIKCISCSKFFIEKKNLNQLETSLKNIKNLSLSFVKTIEPKEPIIKSTEELELEKNNNEKYVSLGYNDDDLMKKTLHRILITKDDRVCTACNKLFLNIFSNIEFCGYERNFIDISTKYCNNCGIKFLTENEFMKLRKIDDNKKIIAYQPPRKLLKDNLNDG